MKRGSFWMTTVATGLMVAGLMTVGRAGLQSQGFLFLAGQMKIAAGDTDSGMKLLAKAASGPELNTTSMLASEKPAIVATTSEKKPCQKMNMTPAPVVRKVKSDTLKSTVRYAPDPTLASLSPNDFPVPAMVPAAPVAPAGYLSQEQFRELRNYNLEFKRAQRARERNAKKLIHEVSMKYGQEVVPDPEQIRMQVEMEMRNWTK